MKKYAPMAMIPLGKIYLYIVLERKCTYRYIYILGVRSSTRVRHLCLLAPVTITLKC